MIIFHCPSTLFLKFSKACALGPLQRGRVYKGGDHLVCAHTHTPTHKFYILCFCQHSPFSSILLFYIQQTFKTVYSFPHYLGGGLLCHTICFVFMTQQDSLFIISSVFQMKPNVTACLNVVPQLLRTLEVIIRMHIPGY